MSKVIHINSLKNEQVLYIKSRGSIIFEHQKFRRRGFKNGPHPHYHPYSSVGIIPELMEKDGFFTNEEDYIDWKNKTYEQNVCKCCSQTKPNSRTVITGKEYYLTRKQR